MSTKTNFKRIAVVAVASLGLGVFTSIAPANAAVTRTASTQVWTTTQAYAGTNTTAATQVVGGTATLTFSETVSVVAVGDVIHTITSSGVGAISAATVAAGDTAEEVINPAGSAAASQTVIFPTTSVSAVLPTGGSDAIAAAALVTTTIVVASATPGVQTLTANTFSSNGSPSGSYTATITWVAATATGVNVANSSFYVIAVGDTCDYGTSKSTDMSQASALAAITRTPDGTQPLICISTRDASGNAVEMGTVTVFSSLGGASISPTDGTAGQVNGSNTLSANATTGNATITAIIEDIYGNVVTMTTPLAYYGSLKTLALANASYAAKYDGVSTLTGGTVLTSIAAAAAGDIGTPTSKDGALVLIGKDANGVQISLNVSGQENGTGSTFTIDSSAVAGTPADRSSDALSSTVTSSYTTSDISELGGNALKVTCGAVKAEKLTITAWGTDSAGANVKSNSVDFYCADAAAKVTVTAAGTSVNVDVTDANSFPVADGTSVALAASNGSVVAPSTKTTANGKFATAATFIANSTAATSSVTAIVDSISGTSAAVKGSGTSIEAQIASMLKLINKIMKRLNIR